jgi:hypothetical protein
VRSDNGGSKRAERVAEVGGAAGTTGAGSGLASQYQPRRDRSTGPPHPSREVLLVASIHEEEESRSGRREAREKYAYRSTSTIRSCNGSPLRFLPCRTAAPRERSGELSDLTSIGRFKSGSLAAPVVVDMESVVRGLDNAGAIVGFSTTPDLEVRATL